MSSTWVVESGHLRIESESRLCMTDALYLYRTSASGDRELRFSLRSVERSAPWLRKVWIFGDRPEWLAEDRRAIEHVPHEAMARLGRWKTPLRNHFLMLFLASLVPGLAEEFLAFSDDFILLEPLAPDDLCRVRVLEDLAKVKNRGRGLWKDQLWRTCDTLQRLGYGTLNFEVHVPQHYTRQRLWDAYCDLQDYVTEDRHFGLLCHTAVFNHALRREPDLPLVWLHEEGRRAGLYGAPKREEGTAEPPHWTLAEVEAACVGKAFLNFDDAAWGPGIEEFLAERFSQPSKFERTGSATARQFVVQLPAVEDAPAGTAGRASSGIRTDTAGQANSGTPSDPASQVAELTAAFGRANGSRGQMTPAQYFRVTLELLRRGGCRLLVIGAGHDTELYVRANAGGRTVVLERHVRWIDQVRHLGCEVYPVEYSTRLANGITEPCGPPAGVLASVADGAWDVILIDAPEGNRPDAPGRQQSILLASQLARPGTTIFLHDWDRPGEQMFAAKYLPPPAERHGNHRVLAVFRLADDRDRE
jgi:hypothetical protein